MNDKRTSNKISQSSTGFTLLEIIVVIVIVGVLSSLALPRFFSTIEYSRSSEALNSLMTIRKSINRCGMANNNVVGCDAFTDIDVDNPGSEPGAHFSYAWAVTGSNAYTITATRNTVNGGTSGDTVVLSVGAGGISRSGTTSFSNVK